MRGKWWELQPGFSCETKTGSYCWRVNTSRPRLPGWAASSELDNISSIPKEEPRTAPKAPDWLWQNTTGHQASPLAPVGNLALFPTGSTAAARIRLDSTTFQRFWFACFSGMGPPLSDWRLRARSHMEMLKTPHGYVNHSRCHIRFPAGYNVNLKAIDQVKASVTTQS